ncbi:MAG: response regulator transcription factor [Bacteroidota bacterium]
MTIGTGKITNIAIMDPYPIVLHGITSLVGSLDGYRVVIAASGTEELLEGIAKTPPDICILDVSDTAHGFVLLKEVKRKAPAVKVLVFSALCNDYIILQLLRNGANGFLEKNCSTRQLVRALGSLCYAEYFHPESIAKRIFDLQHHNSTLPRITEREMEFMGHCCSDLSYKEIGELMGISVRTVEAFRNALFAKFNLRSRTGLAVYALQNGLVSLAGVSNP